MLFKNFEKITFIETIKTNITFEYEGGQKKNETTCTINNNNLNDEDITFNCVTDTKVNVTKIEMVKVIYEDIKFSNKTHYIDLTNDKGNKAFIEFSALAKETNEDISMQNGPLNYTFFIINENIRLIKDVYIIKGKFDKNEIPFENIDKLYLILEDQNIAFNLSENRTDPDNKFPKCVYEFKPKGFINDNLEGKLANSTDGGKILFTKGRNDVINDKITSPISSDKTIHSYVELLGFGNFKQPENNKNATGKIFFSGTLYELMQMKKYLKFTTRLHYETSKLRNLQENNGEFTVFGVKEENDNDLIKGIIAYNLEYNDTFGKVIKKAENIKNCQFSDDDITYTNISFMATEDYNLMDIEQKEFILMNIIDNSYSKDDYSFWFNFKIEEPLITTDKTTVILSYIDNEDNTRKKMNCPLRNETNSYKIQCSKQSVNTNMNTLRINITDLIPSIKLRLLQSPQPTKYAKTSGNQDGIIDFEYDPPIFTKRDAPSSGGLSGGAIAAIVIASIVAVLAVVIGILFSRKGSFPLSSVKNANEVNIANSSTNINQ